MNRQATLKLNKWGIRGLEGSFRRLKDTLLFEEEGDRKIIQRRMVHMYNFQTTQVGFNYIINTFMDKTGHFDTVEIDTNANHLLPL